MKKIAYLFLLATCFFGSVSHARPNPPEAVENLKQIYTDSPLALTRLMLDMHLSYFERSAIRFMDVRISPLIVAENHFEVPVEMSFMLTEDQIPLTLRGFEESSGGKMSATPRAVNVSVSAENAADGKPFLSITVLANFTSNVKAGYDKSLQKAFAAFSKTTTFSPQIQKAAPVGQSKKREAAATVNNGTWITNMRIDSDNRVQLTGYAVENRLINQLCRELEKTGSFSELWLHNMTRNVYEKQPVMRFDLSGKITSAPGN